REDRNETVAGNYSVSTRLDDYLADYRRRGGKAAGRLESAIEAHIRPELGGVPVTKLSRRRIEIWHAKLAESPARLRTKYGKRQRFRAVDTTADGIRQRRSTANRVLTILKAALNLARHHQRVDSSDA